MDKAIKYMESINGDKEKIKLLSTCHEIKDYGLACAKLATEVICKKPKLKHIDNISMVGGVRVDELNLQQIKENNKILNQTQDPFNQTAEEGENVSLDKLKDLLNIRYKDRKTIMNNLMKLNNAKHKPIYEINIDFLNNFYSNFYIGPNDVSNIDDICELIRKKNTKNKNKNLILDKVVGSGAAGVAYLFHTASGKYKAVIKQMLKVPEHRRKYLGLEIMRWVNDSKNFSVYTGKLGYNYAESYLNENENSWMNWESAIESKYKGYKSLNGFKEKNSENYITLSVPSDNFTNQTMMHLILNEIMSTFQITNYIHQYDAFFCEKRSFSAKNFNPSAEYGLDSTDGFNIMEFADGGDLMNYLNKTLPEKYTNVTNDFKDLTTIFLDMFDQVLTPMYILQQPKYAFVHGDFKSANIFIKMNKEKPEYKIADFDKSSITWNGIRFYNAGGAIVQASYATINVDKLLDFNLKRGDFVKKKNLSNFLYGQITRSSSTKFENNDNFMKKLKYQANDENQILNKQDIVRTTQIIKKYEDLSQKISNKKNDYNEYCKLIDDITNINEQMKCDPADYHELMKFFDENNIHETKINAYTTITELYKQNKDLYDKVVNVPMFGYSSYKQEILDCIKFAISNKENQNKYNDDKFKIFKDDIINEIMINLKQHNYDSIVNHITEKLKNENDSLQKYLSKEKNNNESYKYDEIDSLIITNERLIIEEFYTIDSIFANIALTTSELNQKVSTMSGSIESEQIGVRHSPIPFYSSIDMYTLFYSLLYSKIFYDYIIYAKKNDMGNKIVKALKTVFPHKYFDLILKSYGKEYEESNGKDVAKISEILSVAKALNVPFKKNIDDVYEIFGIKNKFRNNENFDNLSKRDIVGELYLTKNKKICSGKCLDYTRHKYGFTAGKTFYENLQGPNINSHGQGLLPPKQICDICKTNKYSMSVPFKTIFEWDRCDTKNKIN